MADLEADGESTVSRERRGLGYPPGQGVRRLAQPTAVGRAVLRPPPHPHRPVPPGSARLVLANGSSLREHTGAVHRALAAKRRLWAAGGSPLMLVWRRTTHRWRSGRGMRADETVTRLNSGRVPLSEPPAVPEVLALAAATLRLDVELLTSDGDDAMIYTSRQPDCPDSSD